MISLCLHTFDLLPTSDWINVKFMTLEKYSYSFQTRKVEIPHASEEFFIFDYGDERIIKFNFYWTQPKFQKEKNRLILITRFCCAVNFIAISTLLARRSSFLLITLCDKKNKIEFSLLKTKIPSWTKKMPH